MQSYGSFQSVSNLLRLVQLDYGLADDLSAKYLHPAGFPTQVTDMKMSMPMPMPMAPVAPAAPAKKEKKQGIHNPGVSCCGTNRFGKLCCNARAKDSEFCRWHADQKDAPVPPRTEEADDEVQSFSIHTPAHSRRPSVSQVPPQRLEAQQKFGEIARDDIGCQHLITKVALSNYEGVAIKLDDNFQQEPLFRNQCQVTGVFLAEVDGYLVPTVYMPEDSGESVTQPIRTEPIDDPSDTEDELPMDNTPIFCTTDTEAEDGDPQEEETKEMTEELFEDYATAVGLDDEFDGNTDIPDDYYPYGVFVSPFSDNTDNLKLLRTNLQSDGFVVEIIEINDDEDEKYLVVHKN